MPSIQNVYYERQAGTARQCFVCRSPTTTVLATIDKKDFIYTCPKHLTDPGFATLIPQPEPAGPSKEEIAKVVDENREREARRAEKSKTKSDDGDEKDEKGDDKSKTSKTKDESESKIPSYGPPPIVGIPDSTASSTASKHRQFALHRGIFSMRERDVRAKEQGAKAKEVGKGLPQVPRGQF